MQQTPLLHFILKQNTSGISNLDFLTQLVKNHPYFSPAQFYRLQQMNEADTGYSLQAAKTALFFNNPHWLNFQLHQAEHTTTTFNTTIAEDVLNNTPENSDNDDDIIIGETTSFTNNPVTVIEKTEEITPNSTNQILPVINSNEVDNTDNDDDVVITEYPVHLNPGLNETSENKKPADEPYAVAKTHSSITEEMMAPENSDNDDDEVIFEKEIAPIKITMPVSIPTSQNEEALTFEPLHLVDYFASQGIKINEELKPADKLGNQLKSFTEWLKTMKKLHVPNNEPSSGISDISIQNLAEKSNTEKEVVTEAMAEVLTRQGKAEKAIELYKKLSLLNPSKNAYFAAKIDQLKAE